MILKSIYGVVFFVGMASAFFPKPLNYFWLAEMLVGFVILILLGHVSAFKQHRDGIFSQWTSPKVFVQMKLEVREKQVFLLGLIMALTPMISVFIKITILG